MKKVLKYIDMNLTAKRFLLLFIIAILLFGAKELPYINLFLKLDHILVFLCIFSIYLFEISSRMSIFISIFFLILSLPWLLTGSRVAVETFGIIAFFILFLGILREALALRKENE
jgi:hypothetical protein